MQAKGVGPISLLVVSLVAACVGASEVPLPRLSGHPRDRFPLALYADRSPDPKLDAALRRAVKDWNALFQETLGVQAFQWSEAKADAAVRLEVGASTPAKLMGETDLDVDDDGVIRLPVRIHLLAPRARGRTSREMVFYQVAAHELGHALGLPHASDPESIMCCIKGRVDFGDPVIRRRYVAARRRPDVRSLKAELAQHYEAFWKSH